MRIALTIVDTPGFGDNIDNEFAYADLIIPQPDIIIMSITCTDSRRSLAISNVNTTTFSPRNHALSVTLDSGIIEYMHFSTLSHRLVIRAFKGFPRVS